MIELNPVWHTLARRGVEHDGAGHACEGVVDVPKTRRVAVDGRVRVCQNVPGKVNLEPRKVLLVGAGWGYLYQRVTIDTTQCGFQCPDCVSWFNDENVKI